MAGRLAAAAEAVRLADQAMTLASQLRHHPLLGYFAVAYGISWGGILVVLAFTGFDLAKLRPLDTGLIFMAMLLGPSIAGLTFTALLDGRRGLRELVSSLACWRVSGRWYWVTLLTMPLLLLATLWPLSILVDPAFTPRFQWPLFAIGLVAGSFEEIGWTGFATPRLLARQGPFIAGLSLGIVWALWHALVDFRQNFHAQGVKWLLGFLILYALALTAYRLLMTWVYTHTRSLLLAVLMHGSYTGWLLALYPGTSFRQGLAWQVTFAALLWVAVTVIYAGRAGAGPRLAKQRRSTLKRTLAVDDTVLREHLAFTNLNIPSAYPSVQTRPRALSNLQHEQTAQSVARRWRHWLDGGRRLHDSRRRHCRPRYLDL